MASAAHYHRPASISEIAAYHEDTGSSLLIYFSDTTLRHYPARFFGYLPQEIHEELQVRLEETDIRSSLTILAHLEGVFRIDYRERCTRQLRKRDALSRAFWYLWRKHGERARLEDQILELWKAEFSDKSKLIGELRGAFKFRHWLAHGRYSVPKFPKYDYRSIYDLADAVITTFPFYRGQS